MNPETEPAPKPCVGCSYCCTKAPCVVALRLHGCVTKCPELEYSKEDRRYYCRLMRLPGRVGEEYRQELFAGAGCCSGLNDWRKNIPSPEQKEPKTYKSTEDAWFNKEFQIFVAALGRQMMSPDAVWLAADSAEKQLNRPGLKAKILRAYKEQRSRFDEEFMGTIDEE